LEEIEGDEIESAELYHDVSGRAATRGPSFVDV
jgi:hypothetical protein